MSILEIFILIAAFIFGAAFGSFACCQAWRIRLKEQGKKNPGKWSVCLSCGKRLGASENIPIISWLIQKGKCKKCGAKIGASEILSELGLGFSFVALAAYFIFSRTFVNLNLSELILNAAMALILVAAIVAMWILLIYDAKWKLLPTKILVLVNILAAIYLLLNLTNAAVNHNLWSHLGKTLLDIFCSIGLLGGTYYSLYRFSGEKLVGGGDWLLALAISLILGSWWLALATLFLSNFLGSIIGVFAKFKNHQKTIAFGPFLVIAFIAVYVCKDWLLSLAVGLF